MFLLSGSFFGYIGRTIPVLVAPVGRTIDGRTTGGLHNIIELSLCLLFSG
jgi:hypothetical protein